MQNSKQMLRNLIIFIILMILTFALVFKNYDFNNTFNIILKVDYKYIILATIVMFLNITIESINIKNILNSLGKKVSLPKMIKYSLIGFFFSGITPAAGGGQPMEIYYMKKDKIPVNSSTIALLLETCSFHIVTIIWGLIGVIINHKLLNKGLVIIFIVGMFLKLLILLIMLICLFWKKLSDFLINIFLKFLTKIKYRNLEEISNNVKEFLKQYHDSSLFIKKHKGILLKSIIIVSFQVLMYYSVTYFVYRSFNLNDYSYFKIITLQALLFVSVASIPLPGAVGISESTFLKLYITIFGASNLASALVLSRGINFYLFMIISMIIVIFSMYIPKKKKI